MNDLVREFILRSFDVAILSGLFAAPAVFDHAWPWNSALKKSRRSSFTRACGFMSGVYLICSMIPIIVLTLGADRELVPIGYLVGAIVVGFEIGLYCALPLVTGFGRLVKAVPWAKLRFKTKAEGA